VRVPEVSRHCKFCDKCVHRFDHHCRWLNNCVGSGNYRDFVAVLVSTLLFTSLQLVLSAVLIVRYFRSSYFPQFKDSIGSTYGPAFAHEAYVALLCLYCVLLLPVVVLIAQLLQFHVVLLSRQQTTFEFVSEASRQRAKAKQKPRPGGQKKKKAAAGGKASSSKTPKAKGASGGAGKSNTDGSRLPAPVSTPTNHPVSDSYDPATTSQIEMAANGDPEMDL
jgi:hypothetical protein